MNRKCKVHVNLPPTGKRRVRGERASEPKSVRPSQRVSEFPKEYLSISHSKLFCTACQEELSLKKDDAQCVYMHGMTCFDENSRDILKGQFVE